MDIILFKDSTTESVLLEIEKESEKYTDLYVDMNNAPERKYVKDKAVGITNLIKKIERARIDKSKEFKLTVEDEAFRIIDRLRDANKPFTDLIDEYKEQRKKILDAEKAEVEKRAAEVAAEQAVKDYENDHEMALLMDKVEMLNLKVRKEQDILDKKNYDQSIIDAAELANLRATEKKEADIEHVSNIRRAAKESLMTYVTEDAAKQIVLAIHSGSIANISITY